MNFSKYKGKILISTPDTSDDIFSRSVVLVIENNKDGSFGFVLNKKNDDLSFKVSSMMDFDLDVYEGGPVEMDKVFFIVKGEKVTEERIDIEKQYYVTEDIENVVKSILDLSLEAVDVKVFSGYSGWEANQLENEIKNKMWRVVDSFDLDYTAKIDNNLWKCIMQNMGGEYLIFANSPKDASLN